MITGVGSGQCACHILMHRTLTAFPCLVDLPFRDIQLCKGPLEGLGSQAAANVHAAGGTPDSEIKQRDQNGPKSFRRPAGHDRRTCHLVLHDPERR